jgi:cell division transport system permease protein
MSYPLRRALRMLGRRPLTMLFAVLLSGVSLTVPLLAGLLWTSAYPLIKRVAIGAEATVFVARAASAGDIKALQARLHAQPGVVEVQWVSRDAALDELTRREGLAVSIKDLKANPLPDVFIVTFAAGSSAELVDAAVETFRRLPRVDAAYADAAWYRKLIAGVRIAAVVAAALAGLAVVMLAVIVIGAVRLLAMGTRDEVRVLQLVGAERRFVARPFLWAGAITLGLGSALAVGFSFLVVRALNPLLLQFGSLYGVTFLLPYPEPAVAAAVIATSAAFGAIVARIGHDRGPG